MAIRSTVLILGRHLKAQAAINHQALLVELGRLETRMDTMETQMDAQMDALGTRMDELGDRMDREWVIPDSLMSCVIIFCKRAQMVNDRTYGQRHSRSAPLRASRRAARLANFGRH